MWVEEDDDDDDDDVVVEFRMPGSFTVILRRLAAAALRAVRVPSICSIRLAYSGNSGGACSCDTNASNSAFRSETHTPSIGLQLSVSVTPPFFPFLLFCHFPRVSCRFLPSYRFGWCIIVPNVSVISANDKASWRDGRFPRYGSGLSKAKERCDQLQ
jgi:hypothetical protein